MVEIVESLAGTGRKYVVLQARVRDGKLHIQGKGTPANRPYGVAVDVSIPDDLREWFEEQNHTLPSLANTDAMYVPIQARIKDGLIHVQVKGNKPYNRSYGAAFDIKGAEVLKSFLTTVALHEGIIDDWINHPEEGEASE